MRNSLRAFDMRQRIFLVKCFYQGFGDYDSVKRSFSSVFDTPNLTDDIVSEIIRLFEHTGSVFRLSDISDDFLDLEKCDDLSLDTDQIDLIYFKSLQDNQTPPEVEEIEFDENLFDIPSSVVSTCGSVLNSPAYDHQSFVKLFEHHQTPDFTDVIREAVEKSLEDLEDPTKSLEASLSPLASLDTPMASLEDTIRELEESLRSIQTGNSSPDIHQHSPAKGPPKRGPPKRIICETCGKAFANKSRLEQHQKSHSQGKPHVCPHCGKTFKWIFAYSRHLKIHFDDGKKLFKCGSCGKSYRFERYLKFHEKNVHKKQERFLCKWCNREFVSQAELLAHWKTHSEGVFFSDTNTNISKIVSDLQCSECGKIFSSRDSLKKHMVLHTGKMPFTCDICGKGFTWKEGVRRHLFKHLGITDDLSPVCNVCGKRMSRDTALRAHMKTHEKTENAFKCRILGCSKTFTTARLLNRHVNDRHSSRRFICDYCDVVYKDKSQLQIHIRRNHLNEEAPFKCAICQRDFWLKRDFRIHMAKHHNVEVQ
ncbi:zinc finger protein OZF-like [Phlebotomus argentipes]|uniref:zinc finger protein OZF-like n=1 Tax=Phlebotomus argentipes TaxID=94469 RepID=UPI002892FF35|nr:zinc finger protein OZF-like [Phlebotomus argentipes]